MALPAQGTPTGAWTLDGESPVGEVVSTPQGWTLSLSSALLVVAFAPPTVEDTAAVVDIGGEEGGPGEGSAAPGGCGCGTRGPSGARALLLAALGLIWRFRRARSPSPRARDKSARLTETP